MPYWDDRYDWTAFCELKGKYRAAWFDGTKEMLVGLGVKASGWSSAEVEKFFKAEPKG